ncbi:YbjN domain-containing protein [Comamonas sp. Tr-654]|uniref:YbjN domain-containing protein n=1 Tax=Comamonas sp. Tr-654 TaxID=2608341 RepID=UPI00141E5285|nr:YbjN domain-containing protein [Comamonas sp. Tr-654]NIF86081.1 YbjN domain-containing protein [Comamonas sp. Tr-654]
MGKPENTSPTSIASNELLFSMNADQVAQAIKAAGCAVTVVEHEGVLRLHSASQGIGFQVLWGNPLKEQEYLDLTLSCPLRVEGGTLPESLMTDWHRSKRFARVAQHGDFVVLEMDVLATGGVTPAHLTVMLQLWSQMMGQFFQHLRNFKPAALQEQAAQEAEAEEAAA